MFVVCHRCNSTMSDASLAMYFKSCETLSVCWNKETYPKLANKSLEHL